jgi:hypothetical protein
MIGRIVLLTAAMGTAILSIGVTLLVPETTAAVAATSTYTASADARILANAPTTNYGAAVTLGADGDEPAGSGKDEYGLVKWNLSDIAPGSKVGSASVALTVTDSSTQAYQAYALKRPWSESEVTWNSYAAGKPWEVAGAQGSLDREATAAGNLAPSPTGERTFVLPTALVQRWVDDPATNHGIIFASVTNTDGFDFYSRESSTQSQRPRLTVNFEGVDSTPPETTIDSGPSDIFSDASASFTFSSNEANSAFECRLDGGTFSPCASPKSYGGLADGSHLFEVRATDAAGNTDATPASRSWTVDTTSLQNDPVFVGAGDIARCSGPGAEATAKLLDGIPGTVYTTGDSAYESGTASEFTNCYDPTWGRHKARTMPSPGNHEYYTAGASGYFGYFGTAAGDPSKGYYSYNLGEWHIVSLNSTCDKVGGCGADSTMVNWLKGDLATNHSSCTLAYFHHPLFSSGEHGNQTFMKPTWDALYAADADVVLNGHDHHYERFAPQDPSGTVDAARGIREFVVGTGGGSHYGIVNLQPNSEVRNTDTFGVLKLTLHPNSYDWKFVPEAGKTFTDAGTGQCHAAPDGADTVAPTVSAVAPAEGATEVATSAGAEATFTEAMDLSTINASTFTLTKQGASQPLAAQVSYDAATKKATLVPNADLEGGSTYTATLKGGAMGVKDLAANPLAADKTWTFTTAALPLSLPDITPPETTVCCGPSGTTNSSLASFEFSSSEPNSTFECSLDGGAFALCTYPKSYVSLSDGSHTFQVRAIDAAGNIDASPASQTWVVDTMAPDTAINSGPSGTITVSDATFSFSSSEANSTFECSLDGTAYSACASPKSYAKLSNGSHTFEVRAKDGAGNVDPTPASSTFTVNVPPPQDTTPPNTIIDSGPNGTIKQNSATFAFSSSEAGSTFECKLDAAVFGACFSPKKYTGLTNGSHTFQVRATDAARNVDPTPASRTWTVRR